MRRTICAVTGARSDYGLLYWVLRAIRDDEHLQLRLLVTGTHLSPEFGLTVKAIEADGFEIADRVEMLLSGDTPISIAKSIGLGTMGMAEAFARMNPDMVLLLGDRFETFAAAQAALVLQLPVAHLIGGDLTEGAFDDAIRHSITKMSHVHFVTNAASAQRVRQLGENPASVHDVGSPGLDYLRRVELLDRGELERDLAFRFRARNVLVTFHPETLADQAPAMPFAQLLTALDRLGPEVGIVLTGPNADTHGRTLFPMIEAFVRERDNALFMNSLGQLRYLSVMAQVDAVVGNSSSGIMEAPSLQKPTVNIGERQRGRQQAASILNCLAAADAIESAIRQAFELDCRSVVNPYGDGHTSARIVSALKNIADPKALIRKRFVDVHQPAEGAR